MQFNYSNANNYLAGAKEIIDISTDIYNTSRVTGVNVNNLLQTDRKARDAKFDAKLAAEKTINKSALNLTAINKKKDIERKSKKDVERIMKPAKRMAGVLAMTNAGLGAKKLGQDAAIAAKESAELKKIREANLATDAKERAEKKDLRDKLTEFIKSGGKATTASTTAPTTATSPSTSTPTLPLASGSVLTGTAKTLADDVAGPESGTYGYEAFNQGGEKGGTAIPAGFKSGNYKNTFGSSLTDKSIGEIMELQRDPGSKVMSDADWVSSGKLHAVGRYQFIGNTLRDEVTRMGLPLDTKFTPKVQDQIFLSHAKRVGNISPWVGPSTKYSAEKQNQLNNIIASL
tara:strand:+ start:700 stop:1734 length:1035 start_codon:yes stop_codon:yes gene_type:complete